MKTQLQPVGDRILVEPGAPMEKIGKLWIPEQAKERPQEAKVVGLGTGRVTDDGKVQPFPVKVGDMVIVAKYGGHEIKVDGKEFKLVSTDDILAVVRSAVALLLLCFICGCSPKDSEPDTAPVVKPSAPMTPEEFAFKDTKGENPLAKHFITGDFASVSNAFVHDAPPEEWQIFCDGRGHYVPAHHGYVVETHDMFGNDNITVRTNRFEAIVAAWRLKGIWDENDREEAAHPKPVVPAIQWSECSDTNSQPEVTK